MSSYVTHRIELLDEYTTYCFLLCRNLSSVSTTSVTHTYSSAGSYTLLHQYYIVQARLAKNGFFWASICHAITDPPVTKSGYGLLLGCRSPLDSGPFENTFFDDVRTQNPGIFTVCSGPLSQSIGRGRISREGTLDARESRERCDKIFAEKTENAKI